MKKQIGKSCHNRSKIQRNKQQQHFLLAQDQDIKKKQKAATFPPYTESRYKETNSNISSLHRIRTQRNKQQHFLLTQDQDTNKQTAATFLPYTGSRYKQTNKQQRHFILTQDPQTRNKGEAEERTKKAKGRKRTKLSNWSFPIPHANATSSTKPLCLNKSLCTSRKLYASQSLITVPCKPTYVVILIFVSSV